MASWAIPFPARRLLIHIDSTAQRQPAFVRALTLAQTARASLRVVDVLPRLDAVHGRPPAFLALVRERMLDRLAEAVAEARRRDVPVTSALLDGDEATALIAEAARWRADVLLRSHIVHAKTPHPPGPVDSQLLRRCPCPVWLVTGRTGEGERVVVAAVDPDPGDPPRHELARRVLATSAELARQTGAQLHVVHAWSAFGHQLVAAHANAADVEAYHAACRDQAGRRFAALMQDAPARARPHLVEGQSDRVLLDVVERRRASLVVMGTIGRTGLAGLVIGNTAERLLRQLRCAVLALKPEGFATETPEGVRTPATSSRRSRQSGPRPGVSSGR